MESWVRVFLPIEKGEQVHDTQVGDDVQVNPVHQALLGRVWGTWHVEIIVVT